jgi:hypothetical protein
MGPEPIPVSDLDDEVSWVEEPPTIPSDYSGPLPPKEAA